AEPLGGTSFEPTSLVTNRRFCACEAGTNRHDVPIKPRSSEAHLIAVARRKQFMSRPPDGKSEQFRFQQAVARTPHKPGQPKRLFHLVFESHDGRALVPSPKRSESRERHRHWNWWIA